MATYETFRELANALGVDPDHPTVAGQQKVRDWIEANPGYEKRSVTNNYLNATPSIFDYNPAEQLPADTPEVDTSKLQIQTPDMLSPGLNAQTQLPEESKDTPDTMSPTSRPGLPRLADVPDSAISAWTPLAASVLEGGDASGEAAGYRAQAAQNAQNAAQNQKIMQWNQQRATDNTLADKIAAAQATSQWKQNANARGAEGGASVVAAANETVTPDIMAQKNYQTQQMNQATQNLAEVNRNKLMQIGNETNESMTNYDTQVEESQNAYKQNLARAEGAQNNSDAENTEEPAEDKTAQTTEKKPDTTMQSEGADRHGDQAPSNQESNIVKDATDKVAQEQTTETVLKDAQAVADKLNNKLKAKEYGDEVNNLKNEYNTLRQQYDNLGGDPLKFPNIWKPSDDTTDVSSIAGAISDVSRMN